MTAKIKSVSLSLGKSGSVVHFHRAISVDTDELVFAGIGRTKVEHEARNRGWRITGNDGETPIEG